jgi:hypothetical protein
MTRSVRIISSLVVAALLSGCGGGGPRRRGGPRDGSLRQGLASYYEVLEAQQQLYPAQTTLAQIRQDRLLAYVRLYKALGGGWSLSDAQWTAQKHEMAR